MGRKLLEQFGFDPDEPLVLTRETIVGAATLNYLVNCGGAPGDDYEVQTIVDVANFDLEHAQMPADADAPAVFHALHILGYDHPE